jgi:hypothetical protein
MRTLALIIYLIPFFIFLTGTIEVSYNFINGISYNSTSLLIQFLIGYIFYFLGNIVLKSAKNEEEV